MAHSHCTGPGTGPELWVYILCYVLFTLRRDRDRGRMGSKPISPPGPVLGNRFLLYPVPFPVLQCEQYTPFSVPVPFPFQVPCIVNEFHRQSSTYIYIWNLDLFTPIKTVHLTPKFILSFSRRFFRSFLAMQSPFLSSQIKINQNEKGRSILLTIYFSLNNFY